MNTSDTFFVICSETSQHGIGLRLGVMWMSRREIIEAAAYELNRSGETLEDITGVAWIENEDGNFNPARVLTSDEVLFLSIQKLGDNGRLFVAFNADESGAAAFIESAEQYGLDNDAKSLVEYFNS